MRRPAARSGRGSRLRFEAPFEEARTLLARGRHRRAHGDRDGGGRDLATAQSMFSRPDMRAPVWAEQASAALSDTTTGLLARLSPAQRRVASALAGGGTNAEIANQVHLSPSTVAWHLGNMYEQLHLKNRAELIARLLRE